MMYVILLVAFGAMLAYSIVRLRTDNAQVIYRANVGGLVAMAVIVAMVIPMKAYGTRGAPLYYYAFWELIIAGLVGLGVYFWFRRTVARVFVCHVVLWVSRTSQFLTKDNASANSKAIIALCLWANAWLYGFPTWGPDWTEIKYQAGSYGQAAWATEPAQEARSVVGFLLKGGKVPAIRRALGRDGQLPKVAVSQIEAPKPLFQRSFWPLGLALLTTIWAFIDLVATRRDNVASWLSRQIHRRKKEQEIVTSETPAPQPAEGQGTQPQPTSAPVAQKEGHPTLKQMFLSDIISDLSVDKFLPLVQRLLGLGGKRS